MQPQSRGRNTCNFVNSVEAAGIALTEMTPKIAILSALMAVENVLKQKAVVMWCGVLYVCHNKKPSCQHNP